MSASTNMRSTHLNFAESDCEVVGNIPPLWMRRAFEKRFTVSRMAQNYLAVYEELVKESSQHRLREVGPDPRIELRAANSGLLS